MTFKQIIIIGASKHAKVVIDSISQRSKYNRINELLCRYKIIGFIDNYKPKGSKHCGYEILGSIKELENIIYDIGYKIHNLKIIPDINNQLVRTDVSCCFVVAIGDNWHRFETVKELEEIGPRIDFETIIHPSAIIADDVTISPGSMIMAGSILQPGVKIGSHCLINTAATLDHDNIVGDFASIAPGVHTGGDVSIGQFSSVSIGSSIIHKIKVGEHSIIGAGAVVVNDIPDYSVALGVPAKVTRTRKPGDKYL